MNNSILFLTENIHYTEKLKKQSNENYNFHFLTYNKFYLHIKDINSYDELTSEEKSMISKELFERITK